MKKYFLILALLCFAFPLYAQNIPLSQCKDESCLRKIVPYDSKNPPSVDSCRMLDGKKSKNDFDEDLGLICRLVVSRAIASYRTKEPCQNNTPQNPDWEMSLSQTVLLKTYNEMTSEAPLRKFSVSELSTSGGYNNSTIHGSYVFDRQTFEKEGQHRQVSFADYFCISASPKHYTPYFSVLKLNGRIADQSYISNPPDVEPIFFQFPHLNPSPDFFKFMDVNKDGKKDLVFLRRDFTRGYTIGYCEYQADQSVCKLEIGRDYVSPDGMFIEPKLEFGEKSQVKIQFFKEGNKVAEATYDLSGEEIKLKQKYGFK